MTKLNKNYIITLIIAIIAVAALVCSIFGVVDDSLSQSAEAETFVASNGNVQAGYVSSYQSISGVHRITDESSLNAFLTAAGTESAPVYGYLANSFSTGRTVKGHDVLYHYLDGCGFKITLTDAHGQFRSDYDNLTIGTQNAYVNTHSLEAASDTYKFVWGDSEIPGYSTLESPFGRPSNDSNSNFRGFSVSGYFGGLAKNTEFKNLKVDYTGQFAQWRDWGNGHSQGIMFGYTVNCTFDNTSLVIGGKVHMRTRSTKGNIEGAATLCIGGYAGVAHNTTISNSYLELKKGKYMAGYTAGDQTWTSERRGYPRTFVGGMAGALVNNSYVYNATCAGEGCLSADALANSINSDGNRLAFSGLICGVMLEASTHAYSPANLDNNKTSACASGTIDGVITSWTGLAMSYVGTHKYGGRGIYNQAAHNGSTGNTQFHFYVGSLAGAASGGTVNNIYYTFDASEIDQIKKDRYVQARNAIDGTALTYDQLVTNKADVDALDFRPVGYTDGSVAPNYINLRMQMEDGQLRNVIGQYDSASISFINPIENVLTMGWENTQDDANIKINVDLDQLSFYKNGMFVWNLHIHDERGVLTEINRDNYALANDVEDAIHNYSTMEITNTMQRYTANVNADVDVHYGFATKYKLNEAGDTTVNYGSKTYDAVSGLSTPTILLKTITASDAEVNLELPYAYSNSQTGISLLNGVYTNPSIWTVYEKGTFVEQSLANIKDAKEYEIMVYNGEVYGTNAKFDFVDESARIVAYRVDNPTYVPDTDKWQPKYTYTINQKVLPGAWDPKTNTVDGENYTYPQSFTYTGYDIDFRYSKTQNLIGADQGESQMTYKSIRYNRVAPANLLNNVIYYKLVDGEYISLGERTDPGFDNTLSEYYRRVETDIGHIRNVGRYLVQISDFSNLNYKFEDGLQKEYEIVVSPRQIDINFKGLDNLIYNAKEQKATFAITNAAKDVIHKSTEGVTGITVDNANVLASNVFEAAAMDITYTNGNNYKVVGTYTIEIALATGAVADNYVLPALSSITSSNGETIADVVEVVEEDGQVRKIIRKVNIQKADVKLVREYATGTYTNDRNTHFEEYPVIAAQEATLYPAVTVSVDGIEYGAYYEKQTYIGFNNVPCIMMGVNLSGTQHEQIYCVFTYYEATLEAGKYVADTSVSTANARKATTYVVKVSFNEIAYANYNVVDLYMVYEVEGIEATVSMDASTTPTSVVYSAQDLTETFSNFASVVGLTETDINRRGMGIKYSFYMEDGEYIGEDAVVLNTKTYKRVENVRNAGKYLAIAGNDIDLDVYRVTFDASCTPAMADTNYPYHLFEITPISVNVVAVGAEKTYASEFTGTLEYEIVGQNNIIEGDDVQISFTSEGFAANADVNLEGYVITAACTGTSAQNYEFNVDSTAKFIVQPLALRYNAGNLTKVYGEIFDTTIITGSPLDNQILEGDEVYPVYASDGFAQTATVNSYPVTATLAGAKAGNYTVTATGNISVTKRTLTLNRVDPAANLVYDGTSKDVIVYFDGVQNEDVIVPVLRYNKTDNVLPINAGHYSVIVTGITNTDNYNFTGYRVTNLEFDVLVRDITVNIDNFIMGYGDTSLKPSAGVGYTYADGSLEFIAEDNLTYTFETEDPATMEGTAGFHEGVVKLTISGDKAANYNVIVAAKGNLSITVKQMATVALVDSEIPFNGTNLFDQIKVDTKGEGFTVVVKNAEDQEVTEVVNVGTYTVVVTGDGVNYEASTQELTFTVTKGYISNGFLTASDLEIYYNKVIVKGKAEGKTISVSVDGTTWNEGNEVTFDSLTQTRKQIFVKFAEDENFFESEAISVAFNLSYDPNAINVALNEFGNKFTFADIDKYKTLMANYDKVSDGDKATVNSAKLNQVKTSYEKLLSASNSVISSAKAAAGKVGRKAFNLVATSASGLGVLVVGLCVGLKKKKD